MKKLEITITFHLTDGFLFLLRAINFFHWAGIIQRAGGTIEHKIIDPSKITMELIHKIVSEKTGIDMLKMLENNRKQQEKEARQICMYLSRNMISPKPSLATVGKYFGNKDHATVLHACKVIDNYIVTEKIFSNKIDEIKEKLLT
jgi:chromosomal replication initiator protein